MTNEVSYIFVHQLRWLFSTALHLIYRLVVVDFIRFTANFFLTNEQYVFFSRCEGGRLEFPSEKGRS
jgi:hypothetical protein